MIYTPFLYSISTIIDRFAVWIGKVEEEIEDWINTKKISSS